MRIHHINAYLEGGAAVAARRLHHGLVAAGVDSRYWHADRVRDLATLADADTYRPLPWHPPAWWQPRASLTFGLRWAGERLLRSWYRRGRSARFGMYSGPIRPYDTPLAHGLEACDLVHLHWVSRIIDYPSFFRSLSVARPLVWTLHDMQPLTGGCHHALDCDRYRDRCGRCPILGRPGERDLSFRDHAIKRRAIGPRRVHVVTPSVWLEQLARQSSVFSSTCTFATIRNGIPLERFFPVDKAEARRELGLPPSGLMIAYAAESLRNEPKGIREFLEAISRLPRQCRVTGLLFGKDEPPAGVATVPLVNLGFLTDPRRQRLAYSAADIFALPSHAEVISQTAVESLACGTPVVAFAVGGIPEIVRHEETGLLARPRDAIDLARAMQRLAEDARLRLRLAETGRRLVEREFEAAGQVRRYRELYERAQAESV